MKTATDYYREGSIKNTTFKEIWEKGFGKYRNRDVLREDRKCSVCSYQSSCFGGCWVMRENNQQCILDYIE
ncbi:SPASM domain-containing protein [Chloroflexota bacterium]